MASIEGTKCMQLTPWRAMESSSASGSRCASGSAITRRAPTISGQKNSHTETSKLHGVFCRTTSCACKPYSCCIHSMRLMMASCDTSTPFGRPVVPEV